jgi:UDP-glucose:(heptosyl)LPS alpha-1,3-glucosyltransferase
VKLAIVRRRYAPFGGAERFIENIAGELATAGHELSVVAESWPGSASPNVRRADIAAGGATRRGRLVHFQREVGALLARERFDLVQTHERLLTADLFRAGDGVHAAWLARLAAEQGSWRAVARQVDPMHRLIVATERKMARETSMVFVANSLLVAREVSEWLGVPASRVRTIENGVDCALFHRPSDAERAAARGRFNVEGDDPVVAFVGSGFDRKGAFRLVDALALPAMRHVRGLIAGRDRRQDALRGRIEMLGLTDRVQLLGGVDDPLAVYHAADLFALPSLYDPMPNAALEALACGLPLVVTADTGIADAVRERNAGVIVTRSPDDIARGLLAVMSKRAEMTDAAAALARRFDLAETTQRWLSLYRELA